MTEPCGMFRQHYITKRPGLIRSCANMASLDRWAWNAEPIDDGL
jgi:hypothetical protein